MDHEQATQNHTLERYLLGELSGRLQAQFEEHFFNCAECAAELVAASQLIDGMARELGAPPAGRARRPMRFTSRASAGRLWKAALAAGLAGIVFLGGYREWDNYKHLRCEIDLLRTPSIVSALPLMAGTSRGAAAITLSAAKPIVLSVDIPAVESFARYDCTLLGPSGVALWSLPVSAEQARDTVSIDIPAGNLSRGDYTLVVHGLGSDAAAAPVELARHRFTLVDPPQG